MAFQTPITIKQALNNIAANDYLLPAIQREVVWSKDQIVRLFDSLMQNYPIGSFLFWDVGTQQSKDYTFYEFMTDYHELNNRHLKKHTLGSMRKLTGVLDGQQRLTALNIGLRGSYADRIPRTWANNPVNYPKTYLYLRLDKPAEENELGLAYDFRFLTPANASRKDGNPAHWFKVADILDMDKLMGPFHYVSQHDLIGDGLTFPMEALTRLRQLVQDDHVINYFLEPSQDLDKVLNIFIRVNSGGTPLSYSDLLLSIAVAQWKTIDARDVVHGLVDELNGIGDGFGFSKDIVLKAGLMLNDITSIAFRVTNFNATNMTIIEDNWDSVANSLRLATRLLAGFGFSDRTLPADSVLLPVAYYLKVNGYSESYLTHNSHLQDRENIRRWIARSILKGGIWGSGLDTLLLALRSVIAKHGNQQFPIAELELEMARRGKSLNFDLEEINDLAEMHIRDRRVFSYLTLLYPGMDMKNSFHIDHVFPAAKFSTRVLKRQGLSEDDVQKSMDAYNRLPNLQLLQGPINQSKQDKMPGEWANTAYANQQALSEYLHRHMIGELPEDLAGFLDFYENRRLRIVERSKELIGTSA